MLAGEQPTINGDGLTARDFTHIANVVDANLAAADAEDAGGRVMNIAMGDSHTLLDLVERLNGLLGTSLVPLHAPPRPGDVALSQADVSLARDLLGYKPAIDFDEGLRRTIEWISASGLASTASA
jgi:UDP-glucose 4-epimerase